MNVARRGPALAITARAGRRRGTPPRCAGATADARRRRIACAGARSSVGERSLHTREVAGSSPAVPIPICRDSLSVRPPPARGEWPTWPSRAAATRGNMALSAAKVPRSGRSVRRSDASEAVSLSAPFSKPVERGVDVLAGDPLGASVLHEVLR